MCDLRQEFEGDKILIIPGHYDVLGGAERQSLILARSLVDDFGCHVDFLGWGGEGILADKVRKLGLNPWVFPLPKNQSRFERIVSLYSLARFIKKRIKPDYLLPFVSYHSKITGMVWRNTGARFSWWNQRDEGRLVYGSRVERRLMKTLPSIVSNSYAGRDFLVKKFDLSAQQVKVINNGVVLPEVDVSSDWREKLGLRSDDILISMIANLTKFKDHETLLRAFAIVRDTNVGKKCRLVLAGRQGETAKELKAMSFDLRLGNSVEMLGVVDPIGRLLSASDLIVHSSALEGCPNAVLEAMAHQRCVVGTDIPGMRQALGEQAVGKYLAPPNDVTQLAKLIENCISQPGERERAGVENRKRIESEFSVDRMTREVLTTIYENRI